MASGKGMYAFLWGMDLGVGILGHKVYGCSGLTDIVGQFPKRLWQFTRLHQCTRVPAASHPHQYPQCPAFKCEPLCWACGGASLCFLICSLLMADTVGRVLCVSAVG